MAGADVAAPKAGAKKKGKKTRVTIHIDMTPMVDVIILLLIFFFMTSQFKEPKGIELKLPNSKVTYTYARSGDKDKPIDDTNTIHTMLIEEQQKNEDLTTLLEVDPKAKYSKMIDVYDEFRLAAEVTKNENISLMLPSEQKKEGETGGEKKPKP
jgi:biopolymer transport protein ExbD